MAHNGFKVLDSDMHCMEPADLWERYIDAAYKPFAPRGLQEYIADLRIVIDGKTMPRHSSLRPRLRHGEEDPFAKRRERFKAAAERGWDGLAQLEAMDTEGIDVAVVYPSRGLFAQALDDLDPAFAARRVKKLMRLRACSISGVPQAVRDTASGLHALALG